MSAKSRAATPAGPPRIEYLRVENYRALHHVELADLTPLTVLLGPNGSGKSTIFDVFNFLSECFTLGLRKAWDKRGRFRELRTRGSDGRLLFELRYRETPNPSLRPTTSRSTSSRAARSWSRSRSGGGAWPREAARRTRS